MRPLVYMRAVRDDHTGLSHNARVVAWAIALRAHHATSICSPSTATIAADAGLSRRSVVSAINELAAAGWLMRVQRYAGARQTSNAYRLTSPAAPDSDLEPVDKYPPPMHLVHPPYAPGAPPGGAPGAHLEGLEVLKCDDNDSSLVDNRVMIDAVVRDLARGSRV